jgi:hypothetical protein
MTGWNFDPPRGEGDCRKLVTLKEPGGMVWVGIRAWNSFGNAWVNNGVLETAKVVAWQELPRPAISDGRIESMPSPTLGDHWTT